jgi:hypothetical protein
MSWHCSRALVEAFSAGTCSDGDASAPLNSTPTPDQYYWPDKTTEHSRLSRFGTTCVPLTAGRGEALLMSFREVSRARTSALPEKAMASTGSVAGSGRKWLGSLAKYDPDSRSWRTHQLSLAGGLDEFSETWPRWGSMRNGESWERETWEPPIKGTASGSLPTPTATDYKSESMSLDLVRRRMDASNRGVRLTEFLQRRMLPTPTAGNNHSGGRLDEWGGSTNPFRGTEVGRLKLNPCWVEQVMGWPTGSTDLKPLETARFQQWLQLHGKS